MTNVWQIVTRFCHARFCLQIIPEQSYNTCCWINWWAQTVCSRDRHHWRLDSEYDLFLLGVTNPVTKVCHALVTWLNNPNRWVIWLRNDRHDMRGCIETVSDLPDTQRTNLTVFYQFFDRFCSARLQNASGTPIRCENFLWRPIWFWNFRLAAFQNIKKFEQTPLELWEPFVWRAVFFLHCKKKPRS